MTEPSDAAELFGRLDDLAVLHPELEDAVLWLVCRDPSLIREAFRRLREAETRVPAIEAWFQDEQLKRRAREREYELTLQRLGALREYVE